MNRYIISFATKKGMYQTCDGFATGIERWIPEKTATIGRVPKNFGLAGSIRWIVRALGDDRFAFQWFRHTVHVFGSHPEHVFLAFGKTFGGVARSWTISGRLPPVVGSIVGYLDDVIGNVGSTVVHRSVPGQRNGFLRGAGVLKRTLRWSRSVDHDHLDISGIFSMLVRCGNRVNTAIFPDGFFNQQVGAIALGFGLEGYSKKKKKRGQLKLIVETIEIIGNRKLTDILRVSKRGFPSLVHTMVGVGAPDNGMLTLMGSPARTLILRPINASRFNFGFSFIGFAMNTADVSLGLPEPAAFIAVTRYSY